MNNTEHTQVRVRFAPSPTGFLHIGGLRTALFNWLFAAHEQGVFLVRIEDTDRDRFSDAYERAIIDSLQWAGIVSAEPLLYQHPRQAEHQKAIDVLVACNKAYYCFCTVEELQQKREVAQDQKETYIYDKSCRDKKLTAADAAGRSYVVRFKVEVSEDFIYFDDIIRGKVALPTEHIDDFVLARSDGSMTYNFAVVVDDHFMKISHVIRGEDHIVNTGKQILLYQAYGWEIPKFGHVSLILGPSGQKLSKRDAAVGVCEYKDKGFLADALCNYLVRLGWSYKDQEVFTQQEMITYFNIADVSTHGAIFDYQKLLWLNSVYIKNKSPQELLDLLQKNCGKDLVAQTAGWNVKQVHQAVRLYQERSSTLQELFDGVMSLYQIPAGYDQESMQAWITRQSIDLIKELMIVLDTAGIVFSKDALQQVLKQFVQDNNSKFPVVAQPIRIAIVGSSHGPGVYDMMEILGKQATLERLGLLVTNFNKIA
jgi:glutamyl-tRNA synthetase